MTALRPFKTTNTLPGRYHLPATAQAAFSDQAIEVLLCGVEDGIVVASDGGFRNTAEPFPLLPFSLPEARNNINSSGRDC